MCMRFMAVSSIATTVTRLHLADVEPTVPDAGFRRRADEVIE